MSIEVWRTRRPATNPLTHVLDRMFEQTFGPLVDGSAANRGSTDFQSLPVNVWETEDTYHVALTAPGLDEQTIEVTVQEDALAIEGTLAFQAPEDATAVWQEFNPGPATFRRSLRLGAPVDASRVEAVYRNGLLMLTLPKAAHSKPRQMYATHRAAKHARKTPS